MASRLMKWNVWLIIKLHSTKAHHEKTTISISLKNLYGEELVTMLPPIKNLQPTQLCWPEEETEEREAFLSGKLQTFRFNR